jgi:glycosyltransferase involved in cell wall biosynthesis
VDPHRTRDRLVNDLELLVAPAEATAPSVAEVGIVVIGRNEGARLPIALESAREQAQRVVYVDSGSRDGSVAWARDHGFDVIELDRTQPFTAARARNAGCARLIERWPDLAIVQFLDGDCELATGWIGTAVARLSSNSALAVVFGRRRERFRDATIFNRLCDMEWDGAPGLVRTCGGDAAMRTVAFLTVGGFRETLIAGEEPDLCHRFRRDRWEIERLSAEMTQHDAAMTHWTQWWQRNRRSGFAGAEAWHLRGSEDRGLIRHVLSNLFWGLPPLWPLWPVLWLRVWQRSGALYATHITLGKLPHAQGQLEYFLGKNRKKRRSIIEYK